MLLGLAIASYLAARIWIVNETVRYLTEEESSNWEAGVAAADDKAEVWLNTSLWAIGATALLYFASSAWYLALKRRR
jgi:hypothetical protein